MFTEGMPRDRISEKRNLLGIAIRKYIGMKCNRSHHNAGAKAYPASTELQIYYQDITYLLNYLITCLRAYLLT
jgi:hypothetical protein